MTRLRGLLLLAGLEACQFGGPTGSPYDYVTFPDAGDDGTVPSGSDDATVAVGTDDVTVTVGSDDATVALPDDSPAPSVDDASLDADDCDPSVLVCDPVHNTGCNPLQQCDVNPTQTTTPAGLCVFNGGATDAAMCTSSIVSESCAPGMTCVRGACQSLCFCDSDCPVGHCCSDTSGPAGFLLCQSCE